MLVVLRGNLNFVVKNHGIVDFKTTKEKLNSTNRRGVANIMVRVNGWYKRFSTPFGWEKDVWFSAERFEAEMAGSAQSAVSRREITILNWVSYRETMAPDKSLQTGVDSTSKILDRIEENITPESDWLVPKDAAALIESAIKKDKRLAQSLADTFVKRFHGKERQSEFIDLCRRLEIDVKVPVVKKKDF